MQLTSKGTTMTTHKRTLSDSVKVSDGPKSTGNTTLESSPYAKEPELFDEHNIKTTNTTDWPNQRYVIVDAQSVYDVYHFQMWLNRFARAYPYLRYVNTIEVPGSMSCSGVYRHVFINEKWK